MTSPECVKQDRQSHLSRLLDAVKQCQVRFGGKTELATEWDSRVACLCSAWESALQHGLRHNNKALSTLKQVSELTGLTKVTGISLLHDLKKMETEPTFWHYVKEHLNKHEQQRFHMLKNITTDAGRGRAWLRAALNEHTLEKYLHMLLESDAMLSQYYEEWAFLRDQERSSMLPTMAAGLGSILFAIKIDSVELNSIKAAVGLDTIINTAPTASKPFPARLNEEPLPVFAGEGSPGERKIQKKKKKLVTIVSFEDDGSSSYTASPVTTPRSPSSGIDLGNIPAEFSNYPLPTSPTALENPNPDNIMGTAPMLAAAQKQGQAPFLVLDGSTVDNGQIQEVPTTAILDSVNQELTHMSILDTVSVKTLDSETNVEELNSTKPDISSEITTNFGGDELTTDMSETSDKTIGTVLPPSTKDLSTHTISSTEEMIDNSKSQPLSISLNTDSTTSVKIQNNAVSEGLITHGDTSSVSVPDDSKSNNTSTATCSSFSSSSSHSSLESSNIAPTSQVTHENLTPLTPDGMAVFGNLTPLGSTTYDSVSVDSSDVASYSADTEHAAFALSMVQKGLVDSQGFRTEGDGSYTPEPMTPPPESMSAGELKQAVVAMMLRKEEVEQENRSLRTLLDQEMHTVSTVRHELNDLSKSSHQMKEKDEEKAKALTRENELLKHQLKKYVNAVQMLRREGSNAQVKLEGIHLDDKEKLPDPIPAPTLKRDYSFEANEYEKKLVQVAEMHGELMEFNEMLHRQLNMKENQLARLRQELVDLRGPLPMDLNSDDGYSISSDNDSSSINSRGRPLVSIWIPSAFMRGVGSDTHHIYQVYVRIRDEEWNVYRRYTEFYDLHNKLRKSNPVVNSFDFPPKKAIGNKQARFVEDRRKRLQHYIRKIINMLLETSSDFYSSVSKQKLIQSVPFFGDVPPPSKKSKGRQKTSSGNRNQTSPNPRTEQYMGL